MSLQTMLVGVDDSGCSRRNSELVEEIAHMAGHRVLTDVKSVADLPVGSPRGQERQHLPFSRCEFCGRTGRRTLVMLVDQCQGG